MTPKRKPSDRGAVFRSVQQREVDIVAAVIESDRTVTWARGQIAHLAHLNLLRVDQALHRAARAGRIEHADGGWRAVR